MKAVHGRLREALRVSQAAAKASEPSGASARELLLFCHGFCTALTGHHEGEDRELFPAIATAHPGLAPTLRKLEQDHSMIAQLVAALEAATERGLPSDKLEAHLEGIAAIMESHFRYEERELLTVLETLALDADPSDVLGPL
nr:hemerythrin domain-containing protein [Microbacterium immunditiarum]